MNLYGLIGFPLSHSFSKRYFTEKFSRENVSDSRYDLYELDDIRKVATLLTQTPGLQGLNVTIPYKQAVIPYLDELDEASAGRIGAVNTIRIFADGSTKGYNTDYYGFRQSLEEWLDHRGETCANLKALVLGTGGASKAVTTALTDLGADFYKVSRTPGDGILSYDDLSEEIMQEHRLIINTTPLGTHPKVEEAPPIPYEFLKNHHFLYDLVYNPLDTEFLQRGQKQGAATHGGIKMLQLQAEKAWEIWTMEIDLWNR